MNKEVKKSCNNCIHYKSIKCELYGWVERYGNYTCEACSKWEKYNKEE